MDSFGQVTEQIGNDLTNRLEQVDITVEETPSWFAEHGILILCIIGATILLRRLGTMLISRLVRRAIKQSEGMSRKDEERREDTLIGIIGVTYRTFIAIVAIMMVLSELGINIAPLLAGAGVAGIALGFGAQKLIEDFISGVFIIMENQYRIGDIVKLEGVDGVVKAITIRTTVLRDLDGNVHHVPNGEIRVATNLSMQYAQVNVNVGVSYDTNIDKVEKIINKVGQDIADSDEWKDQVIDPPAFLRVDNFGDSSIEIKILGKVQAGMQWDIAGELRRRLKVAFDKEGIEIPFNQMVIHQAKAKKATKK